jgi:hypothetical protein
MTDSLITLALAESVFMGAKNVTPNPTAASAILPAPSSRHLCSIAPKKNHQLVRIADGKNTPQFRVNE